MRLLLTIIVFLISFLYFLKRSKKQKLKLNYPAKILNIKQWMLISSAERKKIDNQIRIQTMKRKKNLLKQIRSEYLSYLNSKNMR